MKEPLVLASASPRRAEILRAAGIPFVARPTNIVEVRKAGESAEEYVRRLAFEKAMAVEPGAELVLSADTTVVVGEQVLEKPVDAADAKRMLRLLSGRWHEVLTGVCLRTRRQTAVSAESTRVHFLAMTRGEIDEYVASGEPIDKAGAYAIQGRASRFIDRIEGCYFNVVGLPISLVWNLIREAR